MLAGIGMIDGGSGAVASGTMMVMSTGGSAIAVGTPVALGGILVAGEGAILATSGANNLGSQKGRLKESGPRSPNGKKGGEKHQEVNEREGNRMRKEGKTVTPEVRIQTPGGKKKSRYVDQTGTNPQTGEIEMVQVGKQNKNGTPVKRERDAMDDIENATKQRPKFVPYN